MSTIRFRRFTKPQFLRQIGRDLLGRLFGQFHEALTANGLTLPAVDAPDDDYFTELSRVTLAPDALPENLIEALMAIEGMATAEGQERMESAVVQSGLALTFGEESSHGDIAVQVYLAQPGLLMAQHHESRLGRLSAFAYYGAGRPVNQRPTLHSKPDHALSAPTVAKENMKPGTPNTEFPTEATLALLTADLDTWFKAHNRGQRTTRIEIHEIDGEFWFLIRHGDTYARTTKVEARRLEVLHFRPAREDVVVYCPRRNEIRVHAGTTGEKELYRQTFGWQLFGDNDYFNERKNYTLEPLREDCAEALNPHGLPGVIRIVLSEVELGWGRRQEQFMVRGGPDIEASARSCGRQAIPHYGTIVRAVFEFHFTGEKRPRRVEVRTPNTVKMARGCDARVVHEWLSARGFRSAGSQADRSDTDRQGNAVAA